MEKGRAEIIMHQGMENDSSSRRQATLKHSVSRNTTLVTRAEAFPRALRVAPWTDTRSFNFFFFHTAYSVDSIMGDVDGEMDTSCALMTALGGVWNTFAYPFLPEKRMYV